MGDENDHGAFEVPVTGELDLHAFAPRDIPSVIVEYLLECRARDLLLVRLIHGRGKGVQRAEVRRALEELPWVSMFHDAPPSSGGWGATIVRLKPIESGEEPE